MLLVLCVDVWCDGCVKWEGVALALAFGVGGRRFGVGQQRHLLSDVGELSLQRR